MSAVSVSTGAIAGALAALLLHVASPATAAGGPGLRAGPGPELLYDTASRQVLFAKHVDQPWFPASLTKLMTAYVVFETWKSHQAERTAKLTISAVANSRPKVRLGLGVGKELTFEEAMSALILLSANDIAVALAEAVSGSEAAFVERMNATAARLGMSSTHFINANGLPGEGQYSTARDLAILTQAIQRDFPEQMDLFALQMAPVAGRQVATHNPVVQRVPGGDGMKTGFTCSAGYNIVASATREGNRLVAIVLGEPSSAQRNARAAALLEQGFQMMLHAKAADKSQEKSQDNSRDKAPSKAPDKSPETATDASPAKTAQSSPDKPLDASPDKPAEKSSEHTLPTLDTLPVETFDAEEVRATNLAKRIKACQDPEPRLDVDGIPICPPIRESKRAADKSARAVKVIAAMKRGPSAPAAAPACTPPVVARLKAQRAARTGELASHEPPVHTDQAERRTGSGRVAREVKAVRKSVQSQQREAR